MRFRQFGVFLASVFVLGLLPSPSQAQVVFDPDDPDKATGINNLDIGGTVYNVTFTTLNFANEIYGAFPGVFDFTTSESCAAAIDAVNIALTEAGAQRVGAAELTEGATTYRSGFDSGTDPFLEIEAVQVWEGAIVEGAWLRPSDSDGLGYNVDERVWADFTEVSADVSVEETEAECDNCVNLVLTNREAVKAGQLAICLADFAGATEDFSIFPGPDFPGSDDAQLFLDINPLLGCPDCPAGLVIAWLNSLSGAELMRPGRHHLFTLCYEGTEPICTSVDFIDGCLGSPVIDNIIVDDNGASLGLNGIDGQLCRGQASCNFRRGDSNTDGRFDIADVVVTLGFLFLGEAAPPCLDAVDVDDNGSISISDPVYVLDVLFQGGPPPPPPTFEACAMDPTPDLLSCESYPPCQ